MVQNTTPVLDESPSYENIISYIATKKSDERIPGFPFNEPWPELYVGKKYEIILVTGKTLTATVDDAREFMSEGLQWKTGDGTKEKSVVAAWKRLP